MSSPPALETRAAHQRRAVNIGLLGMALGVIVVLFLAVLFVKLTDDVIEAEILPIDTAIILAIHSTTSAWQTAVMLQATNFGKLYEVFLAIGWFLIGGVITYRAWQRKRAVVTLLLATIAPPIAVLGAAILSEIVKLLVGRARPHLFPPLAPESGFSFPSGHMLTSIAFYGMCAIVTSWFLTGWGRWAIALLSLFLILLVGYSRIYLGVHYPSDVLGSALLGTAWLTTLVLTLNVVSGHLQRAQAVPAQGH